MIESSKITNDVFAGTKLSIAAAVEAERVV